MHFIFISFFKKPDTTIILSQHFRKSKKKDETKYLFIKSLERKVFPKFTDGKAITISTFKVNENKYINIK